MIILFAVLGLALVAVAIRLAVPIARRRRLAWELRRGWWSRFERDFQAYVRSTHHGKSGGRARPGH